MIKRFLTNTRWGSDPCIKVISVVRETDKCYFVPGYRPGKEDKRLKDSDYHETWESARTTVIKSAEERVKTVRYTLDRAEKQFAQALLIPETEE